MSEVSEVLLEPAVVLEVREPPFAEAHKAILDGLNANTATDASEAAKVFKALQEKLAQAVVANLPVAEQKAALLLIWAQKKVEEEVQEVVDDVKEAIAEVVSEAPKCFARWLPFLRY